MKGLLFYMKHIIAMVYDFDGTLSPSPMQEYTVLPELQIKPKDFWDEVIEETKKRKSNQIITYMMLMLNKANEKKVKITKYDLGKMAKKIEYFPGVPDFFERMKKFVNKESKSKIILRHYIISSGLEEIIKKTKIKKNFYNIFASDYYYDHYGKAEYPNLAICDTLKTQFLFRINKGKEKLTESINEYMSEKKRPIPFQRIIYIGDGMTDVPSMTVTRKNGGYALAVYKKDNNKSLNICKKLFQAGRIDFYAEANYKGRSDLDKYIKILLKTIIMAINFEKAQKHLQ